MLEQVGFIGTYEKGLTHTIIWIAFIVTLSWRNWFAICLKFTFF
jgi:hypothetical protein